MKSQQLFEFNLLEQEREYGSDGNEIVERLIEYLRKNRSDIMESFYTENWGKISQRNQISAENSHDRNDLQKYSSIGEQKSELEITQIVSEQPI